MINKIIAIVKREHEKEDYNNHIKVVVKNALKLADIKNADKEIIEIASLLHDIGRAHGLKPGEENNHHIVSARRAEGILKNLNYPVEKIQKVVNCILSHRSGKDDFIPKTIEEKIVANADAMAHFDTFLDLFKEFIMQEEFEKAVKIIDAKIERDWNKKLTIPEAKELVKEKYKAIRLLLDSMEENFTKP